LNAPQQVRPAESQLQVVITESPPGSSVIIAATGEIDMLTSPKLQDAITESLAKRPTALIIDLTEVRFLASAGLQLLIIAREDAGEDVRFAVVADGPATSRPIEITGINKLIDVHPTLDEALARLSAS
jgi:anti-sigma B factor antagonist